MIMALFPFKKKIRCFWEEYDINGLVMFGAMKPLDHPSVGASRQAIDRL